jgi:hypothetical protein
MQWPPKMVTATWSAEQSVASASVSRADTGRFRGSDAATLRADAREDPPRERDDRDHRRGSSISSPLARASVSRADTGRFRGSEAA